MRNSLLTRWNFLYLDVRRHDSYRNLGIPNRHIGVTRPIWIKVTEVYPTTWDRRVELFLFFFFWGSYWRTTHSKHLLLHVEHKLFLIVSQIIRQFYRRIRCEIECDQTQSVRHVVERPSCGTYMTSKQYHTWRTKNQKQLRLRQIVRFRRRNDKSLQTCFPGVKCRHQIGCRCKRWWSISKSKTQVICAVMVPEKMELNA